MTTNPGSTRARPGRNVAGRDDRSGRRLPSRLGVVVGIVVAAMTAASCGSTGGDDANPSKAQAPAGFPVTVHTCGKTLTLAAPPRRVVILQPSLADALIDLGLGDRIVGQVGTKYAGPLPQNKSLMDHVPVLSDGRTASTEVLLGARPDLIVSDYSYRLDASAGGASGTELEKAGITAYIAAGGCAYTGAGGTVSDVLTDIDNLGTIFGVRDRADALVTKLKQELTDVAGRVTGQPEPTVLEFTLDGDKQYPISGTGLDALQRSGGQSIFPNPSGITAFSTEDATARNPQVIIEDIYGPVNTQAETQRLKKLFPTTDAAKQGRIYFLDYQTAQANSSPRIITGIHDRAKLLHPTAF